MPRNTAEYTCLDEYPVSDAPRALEHIALWDPELRDTLQAHSERNVHHSAAAWTTEPATLSFDRDGQAIEVMNHAAASFRLFDAVRENLAGQKDQWDALETAQELVGMMTQPYRDGLDAMPPERDLLRGRISENLNEISRQAAQNLTREARENSPTGEMFCRYAEMASGMSRDLECALSGKSDFDQVLRDRNEELWEKVRSGLEPPDILPVDGHPNPRAEEVLETYAQTAPGWSWKYQDSVRDEIVSCATVWTLDRLNAEKEHLQEAGRHEEARDAAHLVHQVQVAASEMAGALLEVARKGTGGRGAERFHAALAKVLEVELNPENVLASGE